MEQAVKQITLDEVMSSGGQRGGTGAMSAFKANLIHILKQVADPANKGKVRQLKIDGKDCPAVPVGKVVNSLKQLFVGGTMDTWKDGQRYNRSYRYLKGFADQGTLTKLGVVILSKDNHDLPDNVNHIVIVDSSKLLGKTEITTKAAPKAEPPKAETPKAAPEKASDLA